MNFFKAFKKFLCPKNSSNEFFRIVEKRRSIRKFEDRNISENELNMILNSARLAPSAMHSQPWEFVVVKDKDIKSKIRSIYNDARDKKRFYQQDTDFVKNGTQIFVLADKTKLNYKLSAGFAIENIVLAATALNLGSIIMTALLRLDEHIKAIRELLEVPENMEIISLIVVGYGEQKAKPKERRQLKDMVHYDKF